jgi:hypothetical protein
MIFTPALESRAVERIMETFLPQHWRSGGDARAVEQALIEHHGLAKNGGTLTNKINSISPRNSGFGDAVRFGFEILNSIGHVF